MFAAAATHVARTTNSSTNQFLDHQAVQSTRQEPPKKRYRLDDIQVSFSPPPLPPAPQSPHPWTWRCHKCGFKYPLACTRRCLECSHQLCSVPAEGKASICTSVFDYDGWAAWGAYRRRFVAAIQGGMIAVRGDVTVTGSSASGCVENPNKRKRSSALGTAGNDIFATWQSAVETRRTNRRVARDFAWRPVAEFEREEVGRRKEKMYVNGEHNCWFHCDFPAECLHTIYFALAEGRITPSDELDSSPSQLDHEQTEYSEEAMKVEGRWRTGGVMVAVEEEEEEEEEGGKKQEGTGLEPQTTRGGLRRSSRIKNAESSNATVALQKEPQHQQYIESHQHWVDYSSSSASVTDSDDDYYDVSDSDSDDV